MKYSSNHRRGTGRSKQHHSHGEVQTVTPQEQYDFLSTQIKVALSTGVNLSVYREKLEILTKAHYEIFPMFDILNRVQMMGYKASLFDDAVILDNGVRLETADDIIELEENFEQN